MSVEVTPARDPRRPRHSTRLRSHRVLAAIVAVIAGVAGFGLVLVEYSLDHVRDSFTTEDISGLLPEITPDPESTDPVDESAGESLDILLLGSDSRIGDNAELSGDTVEGMRNDTTMLAHISADRSRVEIISFPRDARVQISDCKMHDGTIVKGWTGKFNIAFANGGQNGNVGEAAACVATTIYDLTGILIDHWAVVDFEGFVGMVDALDGVPMCIPNDVYSDKAQLDLEAGPQVLDGETALAWARARTGTGLGDGTDLMRIERQQELMTNMARKALGLNLLTDATKGTAFITALAESLTMDTELGDPHYLLGLAWSLRSFDTSNLYMTTVPWQYPGDGSGDVVWIEDEADAMFAKILADESINPANDPVEETPEPSSTPDATDTSSPEPSASETSSPEPTVSEEPVRETQEEILADCVVG